MMDKSALGIPSPPMIITRIAMEEGWRCVVVMCTIQCVMKDGLTTMLQLSVGIWAMALPTTVS